MNNQEFYVISFDSTHYAIKTEKLLKSRFKVEMIPTPREISASCGLSLMFQEDVFHDIMEALHQDEGTYKVFKVEKIGGSRVITKIM